MISIITGRIVKIKDDDRYRFLDVLTVSGVGYRVLVPQSEGFLIKENITLYTSFQVREDSQTLYGFKLERERDFFEQLIKVSGVGPKTALSILSMYRMDEVIQYINAKDHQSIAKVPGLGGKGAQKIVVELENVFEGYDEATQDNYANKGILADLKEALFALGFSGKSLDAYIKKGKENITKVSSVDELIKLVLRED